MAKLSLQNLLQNLDGIDLDDAQNIHDALALALAQNRAAPKVQSPCDIEHAYSNVRYVADAAGKLTSTLAPRSCIRCGVKAEDTGEGHGVSEVAPVDAAPTPSYRTRKEPLVPPAPQTSAPVDVDSHG